MNSLNRVLIVDDDPLVREVLSQCLEPLDCACSQAGNGAQALALLQTTSFQCVILDLRLPDINGMEVLRQIRQRPPAPPVIVVTGHASLSNAVDALRLGAYDYINKPIHIDVVCSAVQRALEKQLLEKRLAAIHDVWREVSVALNVDQVAEAVLDAMAGVLGFETCALWLVDVDGEREELRLVASRGDPSPAPPWPPAGDETSTAYFSSSGQASQAGRPELALPLRVQGRVLGALYAAGTHGGAFGPADLQILSIQAAQAAAAVENARLYERAQQRIAEQRRTEAQLQSALKQKEILLKEVHHRVKNNLQVVSSLLDLQSGQVRDPQLSQVFQDSRGRIRAMALLHELLYASQDLAQIDVFQYVQNVVDYLLRVYRSGASSAGSIQAQVRLQEVQLSIDSALICGLIINELVSNALKHAFPTGRGTIRVDLCSRQDGWATLTIADDGVGMPDNVDIAKPGSLGLQLVHLLAQQLNGQLELDSGPGTTFRLQFPTPVPRVRE